MIRDRKVIEKLKKLDYKRTVIVHFYNVVKKDKIDVDNKLKRDIIKLLKFELTSIEKEKNKVLANHIIKHIDNDVKPKVTYTVIKSHGKKYIKMIRMDE